MLKFVASEITIYKWLFLWFKLFNKKLCIEKLAILLSTSTKIIVYCICWFSIGFIYNLIWNTWNMAYWVILCFSKAICTIFINFNLKRFFFLLARQISELLLGINRMNKLNSIKNDELSQFKKKTSHCSQNK